MATAASRAKTAAQKVEANTAVLVAAQAAGQKTAEQTRRSVTNPFTFSIADGGKLMLALGKGAPVEIGLMQDCGAGKYIVVREGTALNQGGADKAQTGRSDAAYYAVRNLLSRAATRDIDPATRESVSTARAVAEQQTKRADVADTRATVLSALMLGDVSKITPEMAATLDPVLVAALPEEKRALLATVK